MLFTTVCRKASQQAAIGPANLQMNPAVSFKGHATFSFQAN